jgi:putative membrane protein
MARLDARFSAADREAINRAVADAESLTGAEIIPVIAASSGRYDRSEDIVGLWLAVLSLCGVWWIYPPIDHAPNSWAAPAPGWQFTAFAAAVIVGFLGGAIIAGRVDSLRRLFTPRQQMLDEVQARARTVFFDQRVHHTARADGDCARGPVGPGEARSRPDGKPVCGVHPPPPCGTAGCGVV